MRRKRKKDEHGCGGGSLLIQIMMWNVEGTTPDILGQVKAWQNGSFRTPSLVDGQAVGILLQLVEGQSFVVPVLSEVAVHRIVLQSGIEPVRLRWGLTRNIIVPYLPPRSVPFSWRGRWSSPLLGPYLADLHLNCQEKVLFYRVMRWNWWFRLQCCALYTCTLIIIMLPG